jgi:hypothetical protein
MELTLIFVVERFAVIFNRSDNAEVEMRFPGAVRATGVEAQPNTVPGFKLTFALLQL